MRPSCFAELPGNTRFILVSGLVIVILTAGVLSYIYHESVPRPIYCARTATGPFEAPGELNRLRVALATQRYLVGPKWSAARTPSRACRNRSRLSCRARLLRNLVPAVD